MALIFMDWISNNKIIKLENFPHIFIQPVQHTSHHYHGVEYPSNASRRKCEKYFVFVDKLIL